MRPLFFGLALWMLASPAFGRAGGGERYKPPSKPSGGGSSPSPSSSRGSSPRSSSGSNSSSSGSGSGEGGNPLIALVLLGGLAGVFLVLRQQTSGRRPRHLRPDLERSHAPREDPPPPGIRALMDRDQRFDRARFLTQARRQFTQVQDAWFLRDLAPVRAFLSDATWQRFSTQLALLAAQGVRDATADLRVLQAQLLEVRPGRVFDSLDVRFTASLRDSDAAATATDAEARAIAAAAPEETFTEVWTFVRSASASTKSGTGCPQCGAPFQGNAAGQCEHCQAVLNSGHFDWVVTEMTQQVEASSAGTVTGLREFEAKDPGFSLAVLEDRASLLFWRWVGAQHAVTAAPLAKVSTPAFWSGADAELRRRAHQGLRRRMDNCAVGAVNTRELRREGQDDVAACEVRWSTPSRPERSVLMLKRRGQGAPAALGLSTNRCPACSAPLTDNGQPSCEYCGAALAASGQDWVLDAFLTWEAFRSRKLPTEAAPAGAAPAPPKNEALRLFYSVAAFANEDGVVSPEERLHLRQLATSWGIEATEIEAALRADPAPIEFDRGSPDAEVLLSALVDLAFADRAEVTELKALSRVAASLGLAHKLSPLVVARRKWKA